MLRVFRSVLAMLLLITLLVLTACGPKSKTVQDYAIIEDTSGFELDASQDLVLVNKRRGAPSLAAYNRFIIDAVQVVYNDPKMKELKPEDIGRMQQYFRDVMVKELRKGGYEDGTRAQARTLRISLTISALKASSGDDAASVGEVTVLGVFREALTNRIDAIVVDRSQGSRVLEKKPWSTWADVQATFDKWAKGFRESVDKAHGR